MKEVTKWGKHVVWLLVFLVGIYLIYHGFTVMTSQEPVEMTEIWAYVQYPNMMNAGNLSIKLTAIGAVSAMEAVNASIDLNWFYPASQNL